MRKVEPILPSYQLQNDLYSRLGGDVRCTIQADACRQKREGKKLTKDDVKNVVLLHEGTRVTLNASIPAFLYNKNGKIE